MTMSWTGRTISARTDASSTCWTAAALCRARVFQFELPAGRPRSDAGRGRSRSIRAFFARRIEAAWHTRQTLGFSDSCRVVFGESDGLPGLTVDEFADCLSFQIACLGLEQWKPELVSILAELFTPRGIYERDDLPVREKEGLPLIKTCVYGEVPEELVIREHDARMLVSIANGRRPGIFSTSRKTGAG